MPGSTPARSATRAYLSRCASSSDWVGIGVDGGRVGQRLVEEQPVQVVRQVVVRRDVLPRLPDGVALEPMRRDADRLGRRAPPAADEGQLLPVERREEEERGEVRRRPLAVHVRLAGTGLAVDEEARHRGAVVDDDLAAHVRGGVAERPALAVGQHDRQPTDTDARRRGEQDALGDIGHDGELRTGRRRGRVVIDSRIRALAMRRIRRRAVGCQSHVARQWQRRGSGTWRPCARGGARASG